MVHYGQLVPKGLHGWGGYGGSGEEKEFHQNQRTGRKLVSVESIAVFLWDQERELGFVYIPTYIAW